MPVSGPRWPRAPARGLSRYPCGAVRGSGDSGRGAWRRRGVRHPASFAERLGYDRPRLAPCDGRQRRAGAPDRAARGWRVPAAARSTIADPRSRTDWRRNPHRRAALRGARHGARTAPGTSVLRTDGTPCRRRIALPLLGTDRGRGPCRPGCRHDQCRGGVPGVLVGRQPAGAQRHARSDRARRRRPCHRPAAPRSADLGRAGRRGRCATPAPEPPAAACRGLGRDGVHAVGRRSAGKPRRIGAGVLLRRHRRARARAAYRSAAFVASGQARAIVEQRRGASVPLNRRQAPAVRLGGRRGLRLRADLRRSRTRQVGADEQPRPRLQPARRPGPAAVIRDHRYRAVLGRVDLADPRGPAAGAPPRGWLVRAADDPPSTRSTRATPSSAAVRRCPPNAPSWSICWV